MAWDEEYIDNDDGMLHCRFGFQTTPIKQIIIFVLVEGLAFHL